MENPSTQASSQVEKFYGVAKGRVPGVYTDWATALEQIVGWKGPKYKKFATKGEAEEFVRSGGGITAKHTLIRSTKDVESMTVSDTVQADMPAAHDKKRVRNAMTSHESPIRLGDDRKADLKMNYIVPANPTTIASQKEILRIYTDGSSLGNGKHGARAGLGVYFGPGDPRQAFDFLTCLPFTRRSDLCIICGNHCNLVPCGTIQVGRFKTPTYQFSLGISQNDCQVCPKPTNVQS